MSAEKPITDLSALEHIAEDFLAWRKRMILLGIGVLALALFVFFVFFLNSYDKPALVLVISVAIPIVGWALFAEAARKRLNHRALPLLCESLGLNYAYGSPESNEMVSRAAQMGMFPNHSIDVEQGISGLYGDIDLRMDQFEISHRANKKKRVDFSGHLITMSAPDHFPDLLIRPVKGALTRAIIEPFGGNAPRKHRLECEFAVIEGDGLHAVFFNGREEDVTGTLESIFRLIRETNERLYAWSDFESLCIDNGQILIAISRPYRHFNISPFVPDKLALMKVFSRQIETCALPLRIAEVWHADSTELRPEE
ncbi:hypothetical protein [Halocynthiibacter namhaensis]|uniref:hypothetical protein n=1 Tax=Halocynthiibacter namhaensis TaxID=1290553 RepID=UPI00057951AE|nr:hypothetical protein [Halocynthiibacter namhaensis]